MEKEVIEMQKEIDCEASSVWLEEDGTLYPYIFNGEGSDFLRNFSMPSDKGIAGYCFTNKAEIISNDPANDPLWNDLADKIGGFTSRNIICLPIIMYDEVYGCIQLLNKRGGDFTEKDVEKCREIIEYIKENL